VREDVWITIDPEQALITEKSNRFKPVSLVAKIGTLRRVGFVNVQLYTMEGSVLPEDDGPYWLWVVGRKQDAPAS